MLLAESTRLLSLFFFNAELFKGPALKKGFPLPEKWKGVFSKKVFANTDINSEASLVLYNEYITPKPSLAKYAFFISLENEGGVHAPKANSSSVFI